MELTKWHSVGMASLKKIDVMQNNISELGIDMELTRTLELLQKMLDACHLIDVRTVIQKKKP